MTKAFYCCSTLALWGMLFAIRISAQSTERPPIPPVYANLSYDAKGNLTGKDSEGKPVGLQRKAAQYTLAGVTPTVEGQKDGLNLRFASDALRGGRLFYGLIPYENMHYPVAIYRFSAKIDSATNTAFLNIRKDLSAGTDISNWEKKGGGVLGFRLLNAKGDLIYEGKQAFRASAAGFQARPTITRGPFISRQTDRSVTIWYETSQPAPTYIEIVSSFDQFYRDNTPKTRHEALVGDLLPNSDYAYTIYCDSLPQSYRFRTAPEPGARTPFSFAYASDSRSGYGGGERNIYGANASIMGRIGALARQQGAAFVQFTGDQADGYVSDPDEFRLQSVNWIHAVEPYWHYLPFNVGVGNHESLGWYSPELKWVVADGFPYETHSAEAVFADLFVNPTNGPQSEDGTRYDPRPEQGGDFPTYQENVFYYTYANTAMIVLNSDYWYAPLLKKSAPVGGNLHGYIMDKQLEWLAATLTTLEQDANIDHVFVTIHTPPFPNGGHRGDCMWYNGDNAMRAIVGGAPVEKGIIERRDELLDLCHNRSSKVVAFLCGDEHNYNRMLVDDNLPRYPEGWDNPRVALRRPVWQIINGAAGAPYYAQDMRLPWSSAAQAFTVQNALCFFDINGSSITLRVVNPDTLEELDRISIK